MKNLPYEQNLRQRKELLNNYQKEMTDMKDRKTQEVSKGLDLFLEATKNRRGKTICQPNKSET